MDGWMDGRTDGRTDGWMDGLEFSANFSNSVRFVSVTCAAGNTIDMLLVSLNSNTTGGAGFANPSSTPELSPGF